jgi:mannose-1-phosphate guanylyltransferase
MYVWSAKALCKAFEQYAQPMWKCASRLVGVKTSDFGKRLKEVYATVPAISIDYAISEKAKNLLLLPGNFAWTDVGDWRVAYELSTKDKQGNAITQAKVIAYESYENFVSSEQEKLVALVGVDDLIVVDTPKITLIAKKSEAQNVKKIVETIKIKKQIEYL